MRRYEVNGRLLVRRISALRTEPRSLGPHRCAAGGYGDAGSPGAATGTAILLLGSAAGDWPAARCTVAPHRGDGVIRGGGDGGDGGVAVEVTKLFDLARAEAREGAGASPRE